MDSKQLEYYCKKCQTRYLFTYISDGNFDEHDKQLAKSMVLQEHLAKKHTQCAKCQRILNYQDSEIELVGFSDPDTVQSERGVAGVVIVQHVCKECRQR